MTFDEWVVLHRVVGPAGGAAEFDLGLVEVMSFQPRVTSLHETMIDIWACVVQFRNKQKQSPLTPKLHTTGDTASSKELESNDRHAGRPPCPLPRLLGMLHR